MGNKFNNVQLRQQILGCLDEHFKYNKDDSEGRNAHDDLLVAATYALERITIMSLAQHVATMKQKRLPNNVLVDMQVTKEEHEILFNSADETHMLETLGRIFEEGRYVNSESGERFRGSESRLGDL